MRKIVQYGLAIIFSMVLLAFVDAPVLAVCSACPEVACGSNPCCHCGCAGCGARARNYYDGCCPGFSSVGGWCWNSSCTPEPTNTPVPTNTPIPTPTPPTPYADFSAVCTSGQTYGALSYTQTTSNVTDCASFDYTTFFLAFPTSKQRTDIRTYLGTPTWGDTGDSWYGYWIKRIYSLTSGEAVFDWDTASGVELGTLDRSIDDLAIWAKSTLPSDYQFSIGANVSCSGVQNDGTGVVNVYMKPYACVPTPTPVPPTPTPVPPTSTPGCLANSSPVFAEIVVGSNTSFDCFITDIVNGTVDQVDFSSTNTGVATVSPASVSSPAYTTTASGLVGGSSTISCQAIMAGVSRCSDSSTLTVVISAPIPTSTPTPTPAIGSPPCPVGTTLTILDPCYEFTSGTSDHKNFDLSVISDAYIYDAYVWGRKTTAGTGYIERFSMRNPSHVTQCDDNYVGSEHWLLPSSMSFQWLDFGQWLHTFRSFIKILSMSNAEWGDNRLYICSSNVVPTLAPTNTPAPTSTPMPTPTPTRPPRGFTYDDDCEIANKDGVVTLKDLGCVFERVIGLVLGFAGLALFMMIIMGGFKYITSAGDPKAVESARKTLTYAILGIVLLALSFLILKFIENFTGVEVTTFRTVVPTPVP